GPDPRELLEETTNNIYIASIEDSALALDAIALPSSSGFAAGILPAMGESPAPFSAFDPLAQAIERAVIASIEPDASLGDETPALSEPVPELEIAPDVAQGAAPEPETDAPLELRPTALAAAIPERAPLARPSGLVESIERDRFGGRTRDELGQIRPGTRPESEQMEAMRAAAANPPSTLAVVTAPPPRLRPSDFDAVVAQALIQREAARVTASIAINTPDTSSAVEAALESDAEAAVRPQDTPRLAIPS
ncbi:unnamed protein product, partial [Ectocarpus sp. 12 AP-2014]